MEFKKTGFLNFDFLKEGRCACCGKKTSFVSRHSLKDGKVVCSACCSKIPILMRFDLYLYDMEEFHKLRAYLEESRRLLETTFRKTTAFHGFRLDEEHGLFVLDAYNSNLAFKLEDVIGMSLDYAAEEAVGGFFAGIVTGDINYFIEMEFPYIKKYGKLDSNVPVHARNKHGLLETTTYFANPAGMEEFEQRFYLAWKKAREAKAMRMAKELAAAGKMEPPPLMRTNPELFEDNYVAD